MVRAAAMLAALAATTLVTTSAWADRPRPRAVDNRSGEAATGDRLRQLKAAAEAAEAGDRPRALAAMGSAADALPDVLPEDLRAAMLTIAAGCEWRVGRTEDAYRHALAGTAMAAADDALWQVRLGIELDGKRDEAAVATVERLAAARPWTLNAVPIAWLAQFGGRLKTSGQEALRRRLLAVLAGSAYVPAEPAATADYFRGSYVPMLLAAGERDRAQALARSIRRPDVLIDLMVDPRTRPLLPADFDLRAATERALTDEQRVMADHPDLIEPVVLVAGFQRMLGRPRDALATLDRLSARIDDPAAFGDHDEQAPWWWNGRSRAARMLGDGPAAVSALRRGAALRENGAANVSQVINLAELQLTLGNPDDALATLAPFADEKADPSPYGQMQVVATRACARSRQGKTPDAADLAFARAHATDARFTAANLLACTGAANGAAAMLVALLDDPETRPRALRELAIYDAPPTPVPADPLDQLPSLRDRADIRAAIDRAGGVRRLPIQAQTL